MSYIEDRARLMRSELYAEGESFTDEKALTLPEFFAIWKPDTDYEMGKRLRYEDKLYRVRQLHTSSALYPPGSVGAEALYEEVAKPGHGDTPDDPIPYNNNMELFENKYYSQNGVVYHCFRSTGVAVYNDLSALVGIYVEVYG